MTEDVGDGGEAARGAGHDALRVGLIRGEDAHDRVAVGARANDLVPAHDRELHGAGAEHVHGRRGCASGANLDLEPVLGVSADDLRGVEAAELRLRFPVELELDRDQDAAAAGAPLSLCGAESPPSLLFGGAESSPPQARATPTSRTASAPRVRQAGMVLRRMGSTLSLAAVVSRLPRRASAAA